VEEGIRLENERTEISLDLVSLVDTPAFSQKIDCPSKAHSASAMQGKAEEERERKS
jgi:hypothetical protein